MPENENRQWVLKSRPDGMPTEADFELIDSPMPSPEYGQVLIKSLWNSMDPYMRGRITSSPIGGVIESEAVGRVMESRLEGISAGDIVRGRIGWQEYGLLDVTSANPVNPDYGPISTSIGVLGMPGLTAYFGLLDVCEPKPGDTVVVSSASGAVGAVVGQIAKIGGCRVIGIAGSDEKVSYVVDELGFDAGINYKVENVSEALGVVAPDGVDCYFDNVGGPITEAVMEHLAMYSRTVICGRISEYNESEPSMGPRILRYVHSTRSRIQGFTVNQYPAQFEDGRAQLARWVKSGEIKYKEDIIEGFENCPKAFIGQLRGANFGKLLIKVSDE
ncbi:MAG TPA: NADP-dependent oxidoreductase [Dehalococcoidia bacterium]|nr:NADP-dependent oxidoreductase [Dehalococcoidia bacterium]